jgi:hypothetical protein
MAQMEGILHAFARIIAAGRQKGEIRSTLDDVVLARFISGTVRSTMFKWRMDGAMGDPDEEVENIMCFVTEGLRCRKNAG